MKPSSGLLPAVLLFVAVPALAQTTTQSTTVQTTTTPTLSDLAKRAQEKKVPPPANKTFTNDDLKNVNAPPPSEDASKADGKSSDAKEKDGKSVTGKSADTGKADDGKKEDPTKTEKYWRERMDAAREDVRRNQAFAAALQSRINGLTADFSARDDPFQRAQIADDRQKALAELDRVNKAIDEGNKAISGIEEEARRAMVPAGWIR